MDLRQSGNLDPDILEALTPAQREAVQHVDGPLLMLAGPGSGKTRVVTHRIAFLLQQGIPARQSLALTFTNKAADEMRLRLERLAPRQPVWMGTFHRFCARLLRHHAEMVGLSENYSIYDTDDSQKLLKQVIHDSDLDLTHYTPDQIAKNISWAKNNLISADEYQPRPGHPLGAIVAKLYPAYQQRLMTANAVDFDDLLLHVARLLRENPELRRMLDERYRYVMVDEYQDTNLAQYAIVRALSIDYPNLAVTGDPDQSIYGWRGANLSNILEFERDFPEVRIVRLEQNYRSTKSILRVADQLIAHNVKRKEKALFTDNDDGLPVRLITYPTQRDEADHIAARIADDVHHGRRRPRDFAIFYRVNALSRSLEHALREHGIPYQIVNGWEFYQRKEIKDVIGYLQLINNPRDDVAFLRIINTPPRRIGKATIAQLASHARRYGLPLLDAAREAGLIESLSKNAPVAVAKFVAMYDRLRVVATAPVEEVLGHVLTESGYHDFLANSTAEEDQERLANIEELLTAAREFDEQNPGEGRLEEFLEQASLVSDTDAWETEIDKVTMMTLHAAKGLEFPVVFIVAVEEGLLPHERSREDKDKVEEERRLLFVGITRAEQELQLSLAQYRSFRGGQWPTVPSQFLMELPRDEMERIEPVAAGRRRVPWDDDGGDDDSFDDDQSYNHDEFSDDEYVQDDPTPQSPAGLSAKIMTAAEMLAAAPMAISRVAPHVFQLGMPVHHPEYGQGVIMALSGEDSKRTATVKFLSAAAGLKKFRLAHSPLQPLD
jgi:DNA helicase-2/ATP-dependent DNA helicase PcrA